MTICPCGEDEAVHTHHVPEEGELSPPVYRPEEAEEIEAALLRREEQEEHHG
jgi:hypothetical protein